MYQNIQTKVLTGEVRLSYEHLSEPYSNNGGEPKYSVTMLVPKADAVTKADIDASIRAAFEQGKSKTWGGIVPPNPPVPVYDGDGVRPNGMPFGDECKGCWVFTASSKIKPHVVHQSNIAVELAPCDVYSGMYARVTVNFFAYNAAGKRGVGCGLGNVMKTRDGEPMGGRISAQSDFADIGTTVRGLDF